MKKIEIYDYDAKRISELADTFDVTNAEIVEALVNMLEHEAFLLDKSNADILEEHL